MLSSVKRTSGSFSAISGPNSGQENSDHDTFSSASTMSLRFSSSTTGFSARATVSAFASPGWPPFAPNMRLRPWYTYRFAPSMWPVCIASNVSRRAYSRPCSLAENIMNSNDELSMCMDTTFNPCAASITLYRYFPLYSSGHWKNTSAHSHWPESLKNAKA